MNSYAFGVLIIYILSILLPNIIYVIIIKVKKRKAVKNKWNFSTLYVTC